MAKMVVRAWSLAGARWHKCLLLLASGGIDGGTVEDGMVKARDD